MSAYTLGRACSIVGRFDSSAGRLAVFADVARKNVVIGSAYALYDRAPGFIKPYLLMLYGLKCYLSVNWKAVGEEDIVFLASYPNERAALGHVRRHLRGLRLGDMTLSKAACLGLDSLRALPRFLASARRFHRFACRLAVRHPFMPACRVLSTVTYYTRFRYLLGERAVRAVFIANHYSPECLALAAAAHGAGRKVLFTNHANATWQEGYLPPLYSDLAAVTSQAVLDTYRQNSHGEVEAVFVPQAAPQRAMQTGVAQNRSITVGIFLTALTNMERLQDLVDRLAADPKVERILIRPHPVKVVNEDISALCPPGSRVEDTVDMPLTENIGLCDLAICGNSTVAIEVLRGGVPLFYDQQLDRLRPDYNGYLKGGLVPPMPANLDDDALRALTRFYGAPAWTEAMRYFDAGYLQEEGAMIRQLNDRLHRMIAAPETAGARIGRAGVAGEASSPLGVT